jgi:hypothetical protein
MQHTEPVTTETEPDGVSEDDLFTTLSSARRRYVLACLSPGEPVTVRALSEAVAAVENDKPVTAVETKERRRVYTALYQTHLPQLARVGAIEYDRDRGVVTRSDRAAVFEGHLAWTCRSRRDEAGAEDTDESRATDRVEGEVPAAGGGRVSLAYLALALVSGVVALGAGAGVVPGHAWVWHAVAVTVATSGLAVGHLWTVRGGRVAVGRDTTRPSGAGELAADGGTDAPPAVATAADGQTESGAVALVELATGRPWVDRTTDDRPE